MKLWSAFSTLAMTALLALPGAMAESASADTSSGTDSYGGNKLVQWIDYDYVKNACDQGADAFQLLRTRYKFTRADSQFTLHFDKGMMSEYGSYECAGSDIVTKSVSISGPGQGVFTPGTVYKQSFGSTPWVYLVEDFSSFGAYIRSDLWRSQREVSNLCTAIYITQPGNPCVY